jgi:hypothetical protein
MYKIYRLNGQEYHVYPSGEQKFLSENPDAELVQSVEEPTSISEVATPDLREPEDVKKEIEEKQKEADKKYRFKAQKGTVPGNLEFEGEYIVSKQDLFNDESLNIKTEEDLQSILHTNLNKKIC